VIEVNGLYAGYGGADVIRDISFKAERGESLCILGPNGCGKSTLLKAIARIIGCRGRVTLDGRDVSAFARKDLARKIALLGQSSRICFPYTVRETVSLGRYAHSTGFLKNLSAGDEAAIDGAIRQLDLWDIQGRMINELSGGQLQRVFVAEILAQDPELILLDEPTNHLDLKNQVELLGYLRSWVKEKDRVLIGVFHDLNLVHHFGDTVLLLSGGKTAAWGGAGEILRGEILKGVYGIDIRGFMLESLKKWEPSREPPRREPLYQEGVLV
jgi:iron complex transport system ATP-binding protein